MTEQRPLKVFLCHASADKPAVRKLHRYLKQRGVQPWLDEIDLLPGQDWQIEIPSAIFTSDVIVVCLSKNSVDKEGYVQKEITYALDKAMEKPEGTIFIIPAKLEECNVPNRLSRFQWVDLYRENGRKKLVQSLNLRAESLGPEVNQVKITAESSPKLPKLGSYKSEQEKPNNNIDDSTKETNIRTEVNDLIAYSPTGWTEVFPIQKKPIPPAESIGDGSVDIGGDVKGAAIITGDNNLIVQSHTGEREVLNRMDEPTKSLVEQDFQNDNDTASSTPVSVSLPPSLNLLGVILPPILTMVAYSIVWYFDAGGNVPIIFYLIMPLIGLGTPIFQAVSYNAQKKAYLQKLAENEQINHRE